MVATTKRTLKFDSGDQVIAEINRLRTVGYTKTKNWNLTQVCEHLSATMTGGMEGFGFRLPWILRATIVKWVFRRLLRTGKMPSGPTLERLRPKTSDGPDDDSVIDQCIATIEQSQTFSGSMDDYPFLDDLSVDDWRKLMWIHAAHHLGFLIPRDETGK